MRVAEEQKSKGKEEGEEGVGCSVRGGMLRKVERANKELSGLPGFFFEVISERC